jgi:hypothetical protein
LARSSLIPVTKLFFQLFLSTLFFSFRKRKEKRDQKKRKLFYSLLFFCSIFSFSLVFLLINFFFLKEKVGRKDWKKKLTKRNKRKRKVPS